MKTFSKGAQISQRAEETVSKFGDEHVISGEHTEGDLRRRDSRLVEGLWLQTHHVRGKVVVALVYISLKVRDGECWCCKVFMFILVFQG